MRTFCVEFDVGTCIWTYRLKQRKSRDQKQKQKRKQLSTISTIINNKKFKLKTLYNTNSYKKYQTILSTISKKKFKITKSLKRKITRRSITQITRHAHGVSNLAFGGGGFQTLPSGEGGFKTWPWCQRSKMFPSGKISPWIWPFRRRRLATFSQTLGGGAGIPSPPISPPLPSPPAVGNKFVTLQ